MADCPTFRAVCKKEWLAVVADLDELPISNINALIAGFRAAAKEDASDDARADELWAKAEKLLDEETQDDEGVGATGVVQVTDDFEVSAIGGWP